MRTITLKDLWIICVRRLWIIFLSVIITTGAACIYFNLTFVPQYASTATLYILRQDGEDSATHADSDFSLALKVVSDCTYLLKSHAVIDQVIEELSLDMAYNDLYDQISTFNPENTRILEVTVEADSPEQAKQIVDRLCEIGQGKIAEAMGFQQVNFYEHGTLENTPCNRIGLITYTLIGLITAVLVYSVFLIAFLIDDRIRTDEDIQQYLGLSILGNIPNADSNEKNRYGYYSASGNARKGKVKK